MRLTLTSKAIACTIMLLLPHGSLLAQSEQQSQQTDSGNTESVPNLQHVLQNIKRQQEDRVEMQENQVPSDSRPAEPSADVLSHHRTATVLSKRHEIESIVALAEKYALEYHSDAERVEVNITRPDSRIRLSSCENDLTFRWTSERNSSGHTSITAMCEGTAPWKVLMRATIRVYQNVPILLVPVNKDDVLSPDMVTTQLIDITSVRKETMKAIDSVIGFRFKRRVAAGKTITSAVLAAPRVIRKGDQVLISASNSILDIRMKGTAMSAGEVGKLIKVRSNSSGRVIQSMITGPGMVEVTP